MNRSSNAAQELETRVPTMKGVGITNVRDYVETTFGAEKWSIVLAALNEEDRAILSTAIAVGWYDVTLFARLLRAVDSVCGAGDLSLMGKVGAHEAKLDFNRVLRVFLRVLTPPQIFKAEARLWKHFQDSGEWSTVTAPGGMDATLVGWEVDEALCKELSGYLVKLVEFTGGKDVTVVHRTCRARGADRCVFEYRWK